jgi:hypothetical protein
MNKSLLIWCGVLAACGDSSDGDKNPSVLWLALDGSETRVRLVDKQPQPY